MTAATISPAVDTLARTIWGEARGEGITGMQDIACVVMNRVAKARWWGHDVVSVCRKAWQFSCWNAADPNREKLEKVTDADPQFRQALQIAADAIAGKLHDRTGGATSYYDIRMPKLPEWAKARQPCLSAGHHRFFIDP